MDDDELTPHPDLPPEIGYDIGPLGIRRDSTLNTTNDLQIFAEEFVEVVKVGMSPEALGLPELPEGTVVAINGDDYEVITASGGHTEIGSPEYATGLIRGEPTCEPTAPHYDVPDKPRFEITDDSKASWAFRKIAAHQAEIARCRELADDERARIDQWEEDACRTPRRKIANLEAMLTAYAETLIDADPKRRKWSTPGGDIIQRKGRDKIEVTDEEAFIAWALGYAPEAVKIEPRTSKLGAVPDELTVDAKGKPTVEGQRSRLVLGADVPEPLVVPGVAYVVGSSKLVLTPAGASEVDIERPEWDALIEDDDE